MLLWLSLLLFHFCDRYCYYFTQAMTRPRDPENFQITAYQVQRYDPLRHIVHIVHHMQTTPAMSQMVVKVMLSG